MSLKSLLLVSVLTVTAVACGGGGNPAVECKINADCNLVAFGTCDVNPITTNRWCSYPDSECPSGRRWSDFDTGDGLSGVCQQDETADAGIPDAGEAIVDAGASEDAPVGTPDAAPGTPDAAPSDAGILCTPKLMYRRDDGAGTFTVRTVDPDGTNDVAVHTGSAQFVSVDWSHDGARFLVVDDGADAIQIRHANGSLDSTITVGTVVEDARWSLVAAKIAYVTTVSGVAELHTVNADGSGDVMIHFSDDPIQNPQWSHDGSKIAFLNGPDIFVINSGGTGVFNVTTAAGGFYGVTYVWTPNDTKFVFQVPSAASDIGSILVNGTGRVDLATNSSHQKMYPHVSPDGSSIVYSSTRITPDGGEGVYKMGIDGSGQVQLAAGPDNGFIWFQPRWSPDGLKIAYVANTTGFNIWTMGPDGAGKLQLTTTGTNSLPFWRRCP